MWALRNHTSYAAERNWTRGKGGEHYWVVAVKGTFDIARDGSVSLAHEQHAPVLAPEYLGDAGRSSLLYDSDLLAIKPLTDVLAHAHAYAPRGAATESVTVALRVADINKTLIVHGPRFFDGSGGLTSPEPFVRQPITYEWAFGGSDELNPDPTSRRIDLRNPVGKGFTTGWARRSGPAHLVEYPSGRAFERGPAGFGPIDRSWSPRLELAGTYGEQWARTKRPLLADDYDDRHALCAPLDQQPSSWLRGGEVVDLLNMTEGGLLRFSLPKLYFAFTTSFGTRRVEHRGHLVTVLILPESMQVCLVWQTALLVPARSVEQLDETVVAEKEYLR